MSQTSALSTLLGSHHARDEKEQRDLEAMRDYATSLPAPFSNLQPEAHFTGSALIVDATGERVLFIHHRKLNRWLQPGGHAEAADGGDMLATALREAREETGLDVSVFPGAPQPLDVDVHTIPAKGELAMHAHLDVRFLLRAERKAEIANDPVETLGAKWLTWDEAREVGGTEVALLRLIEKGRAAAQRTTPT